MSYGRESGAFLPTTTLFDISQLYSVDVKSPQFKELLVQLYQSVNNLSVMMNIKDSALYHTDEFVCGQKYFPNPFESDGTTPLRSTSDATPTQRQVYRKVINFGALPNATTSDTDHNISVTGNFTFTRIYGASSDTTNKKFIPLPYASTTDINNIELYGDATKVYIKTGADYSDYKITYIVLEYLKQ